MKTSPLSLRPSARAKISSDPSLSFAASAPRLPTVQTVATNGHHALIPISPVWDIEIFFPGADRILVHSPALFSDAHNLFSRRFMERAFLAPEVKSVAIEGDKQRAEISFQAGQASPGEIVRKISRLFAQSDVSSNGQRPLVFPSIISESKKNEVRVYRYGSTLSTWAVKHETEGRIRFRNGALHRKRELCQAIERELMSVPGVDRYHTNDLTASVLVYYDNRQIQKHQLIEILDEVLHKSENTGTTPADLDFPLATASLGLAAACPGPDVSSDQCGDIRLLHRSQF